MVKKKNLNVHLASNSEVEQHLRQKKSLPLAFPLCFPHIHATLLDLFFGLAFFFAEVPSRFLVSNFLPFPLPALIFLYRLADVK